VIETLLNAGYLVIAAGGGGIPVVQNESGQLRGVEAVVDKDLASSLLGEKLGARLLVILTVHVPTGSGDRNNVRHIIVRPPPP
jgi:carbamate kinase